MNPLLIMISALSLAACSFVTPTCRYVQGPVNFALTGNPTGGSVTGKADKGGTYMSYPAHEDGTCPKPPDFS